MKNSGIEWIGEIPDDWKLIRFKDICVNRKEIAGDQSSLFDRLALTLTGVIRRDKNDSDGLQPKEFDGYQIIYENDFIFKMIDLQNINTSRVGLSPYTGLVSPAYIRFSPRKKGQYNLFVYYFLMSLYYNCVYNNLGGNGVRSALNATDMGQLLIPFPSIDTQIHIVSMIENRCAAVDKLIENQRAQIEKLKEYKQSVITEAVTRGLDPSAPMKDSGVAWIGDIPAGWNIIRGKNILALLNRPVLPTDNVITCFRDGEVTLRSNRREEGFTFSEKEIGYQGVDAGDLVVHGMDGFAGAIGISDSRGKASPVLIVLNSKQNKRYLMFYLRSIAYRNIFLALSTGIRVRSCDLRWNKLSALPFLVPSLKEQDEIVVYIDHKLREIDKLISVKQQKIETLTEYIKSLIYEYVTGKKEVG